MAGRCRSPIRDLLRALTALGAGDIGWWSEPNAIDQLLRRIEDSEPYRVLAAIPVLRVVSLPDAAQCCGSAGLFTLLEPAMSRAVLAPKLASLRTASPQVVATGNPGCLMQLGAGLAAGGLRATARHPVELLDESYRAAGYYA